MRAKTVMILILLNLILGAALVAQSRNTISWWRPCCQGDGPEAYCCYICCWWGGEHCDTSSDCRDGE